MIEFYLSGIIGMAVVESIHRGYKDEDIDGQVVFNAILWPLVAVSIIGQLIRWIKTSEQ